MTDRCQCGKKKNPDKRLCGECSYYFTIWRQIRLHKGWPGTRAARYAWHEMAGIPAGKAREKWAHGDYTRLFNWTRAELAGDNLDAALEAANPEIAARRELVTGIEGRETDAYVSKVAGGKFGWKYGAEDDGRLAKDWREMELGDLRQLSWTISNRSRSQEAGEREGISADDVNRALEFAASADAAGEGEPF